MFFQEVIFHAPKKSSHRLESLHRPPPGFRLVRQDPVRFALLAGVLLGAAAWIYNQELNRNFGLDSSHAGMLHDPSFHSLVFTVTLFGIAFGCYVLVVGAFFFHRVAGPIYWIKCHMLDTLDGQPVAPMTLRKNDQMHDVAEAYNALLKKFGVIGGDSSPEA